MDAEKRKAIFESFLHKDIRQTSGRRAGACVCAWLGSGAANWASRAKPRRVPPSRCTCRWRKPEAAQPKAAESPWPRLLEALRETILVVDDEAGIRALIVKILRRERYRVLEAGSATEAVAVAATHGGPIQLLLTDVMLPDRNGRQLATQLLETRPGLKVMYISGFTDDESVRTGAFPPGARFLQKPFTLGALIGTVREALDQ